MIQYWQIRREAFLDAAKKTLTELLDSMLRFHLLHADKVLNTMDQYVDDYGIIHHVCGCPDFISEGTSAESMAAYIMMHANHSRLT